MPNVWLPEFGFTTWSIIYPVKALVFNHSSMNEKETMIIAFRKKTNTAKLRKDLESDVWLAI